MSVSKAIKTSDSSRRRVSLVLRLDRQYLGTNYIFGELLTLSLSLSLVSINLTIREHFSLSSINRSEYMFVFGISDTSSQKQEQRSRCPSSGLVL